MSDGPRLLDELKRRKVVRVLLVYLAAAFAAIEAADMLLPAGGGDVASLNDRQLRRIGVVQDWFCDPDFLAGGDSVCLLAESRGLIHPRVARLPQVLSRLRSREH